MSKKTTPELLFKELAKKNTFPRCLCVISPDKVRLDRAIEFLISSVSNNSNTKPDIFRFSLRGIKDAELISLEEHALSPSLFSSRSLIILSQVEHVSASIGQKILKLIENSLSADFIICGEKIAKNTTFYKQISSNFLLTNLAELKGKELNTWISKELKRNGIQKASSATIDIIAKIGEENLDKISNMCLQLGLYSEDGSLTPSDIYVLFHQIADPNEFGLPDTIVGKNSGDVEVMIEELMQTGKNSFLMLLRLFWTYNAVAKILSLQSRNLNTATLAQKLSCNEWVLRKYLTIAKHYNSELSFKSICAIAEADSKLKNKSTGETSVLSNVCQKLSPKFV
ncbi:MAG: DNA polymerase III subunit delta [Bdellovibrionales bacterium]|nr:DNA polymerase III subunit delta [Bdellovibrionales bacterium]